MVHHLSLYVCCCFFMVFFLGTPGKAQTIEYFSRSSVDSLLNPIVMSGGDRVLNFVEKEQSVGVMFEYDAPKSLSFIFRNVGTKVTKISNVKTFCGCTLVAYDKCEIGPDSVGKIVVSYNPKNQIGTVYERIYVYTTDSEEFPVACLSISGEVRNEDPWRHLPKRIGNLRLKRKTINFMVDTLCASTTERIWCGNTSIGPLRIVAKELPACLNFRMEPEVLQPGEEGDMVITIDNEKLPKGEDLVYQFVLEGTGDESENNTIKIKVNFCSL